MDEVRNPHELFAVERQRSANAEPERFTRPQYDALVRETGVFSDAFAMGPDIDRRIDGRRMEGSLVTGNFFHVLGVSAARGRTLTPVGRRARRPSGPCPQPSRLVPTFRERSRRSQPHGPGERTSRSRLSA